MALAAGDVWLKSGANLLLFGPPGGGKSHLSAALGLALVENGWRVLFTRTTDLVQRLQVARRELALEAAIARLDRYDLLILGDIAYVTKDQAETSVLFELIAARYERRSLLARNLRRLPLRTRAGRPQATSSNCQSPEMTKAPARHGASRGDECYGSGCYGADATS
jgi:DNA replication protein DnaC